MVACYHSDERVYVGGCPAGVDREADKGEERDDKCQVDTVLTGNVRCRFRFDLQPSSLFVKNRPITRISTRPITNQLEHRHRPIPLRIMAKKISKSGTASAAPPKPTTTNTADIDIDDIFSGKPLKSKSTPLASSSTSASTPKIKSEESTSKAGKNKKKKKVVENEAEEGSVNGGKGKRKADSSDPTVEPSTNSKKSKIETKLPKSSKPSEVNHLHNNNNDDDDFTDNDKLPTSKVLEILDPSAVSRSKVKQALQPPISRSKGGRREVDAEEEMFRDSRGDGPSKSFIPIPTSTSTHRVVSYGNEVNSSASLITSISSRFISWRDRTTDGRRVHDLQRGRVGYRPGSWR
jgi:hypothetical protein